MPKPYKLLRKEIKRISGLQDEIHTLLKKDWSSETRLLKELQRLLIVNVVPQESYSQEHFLSFHNGVIKIINSKTKKSILISNLEHRFLMLGFFLIIGKRVAIDQGIGLELIQDVEAFSHATSRLGLGLILFGVALKSLLSAATKINIEKTIEEREESQYKVSKILALLQELERACENLSLYRYLCAEKKESESHLKLEKKDVEFDSTPTQSNEADQCNVATRNKLTRTKYEKISEKVAAIIQHLPPDTLSSHSSKSSFLRVKIPVQELEKKLSGLKDATIKKLQNGTSLSIRFSDNIEIRLIGEKGKKSKPSIKEDVSKKLTSPLIKKQEASAIELNEEEQSGDINEEKEATITVEYRGSDTSLPDVSFISEAETGAIVQAIQYKIKSLMGKSYKFFTPESKTYDLLSEFIQLAYVIKKHHPKLSVLAFGGVWRSLLMGEEPIDVDIAIVAPSEFDPEKDLFEPLKQSELIDDYRRSAKPTITLYTVSFLNSIHEITIFKNPSIEENARTLDFTCNVFALEIVRFDSLLLRFYTPLTSEKFLLEVKKGMVPTIEAVINPSYLTILKNSKMRTRVVAMISSVFPDWTTRFINSVMDVLIKDPDKFSTVQPTKLVFLILTLLNFIDDPKRIMRLLSLYQSGDYQLQNNLQMVLYLVPPLLNTVIIGCEEKSASPSFSRINLLNYFREYMIKLNGRPIIKQSPLSDLKLLKAILLAGISHSSKQKSMVDMLFSDATMIYEIQQICGCLLGKPNLLLQPKRKTAMMDCLLLGMTLTRTPTIFSTIHTVHTDSVTFTRCYLLPAFIKELQAIANLFQHAVNPDFIDQEQLSNILLYKWYEYSCKDNSAKESAAIKPTMPAKIHTARSSKFENNNKTQKPLLAPQARLFHPVTEYTINRPKAPSVEKSPAFTCSS